METVDKEFVSKEIKEKLKEKKVLVCHSSSILRTSIIRALAEFEVSSLNSNSFDGGLEQALTEIENTQPDIIICPMEEDGKSFTELLSKHSQIFPNRLEAFFIILSEQNNMATASSVLEFNVDGLLTMPFSPLQIHNFLAQIFSKKLAPGPAMSLQEQSREFFNKKDKDSLKESVEKCQNEMKDPSRVLSFYGELTLEENNFAEAEEIFSKGLAFNEKSYPCLVGIIESLSKQAKYNEAYDYFSKLLENYPLYTKRIPQIIKLCVATGHHEDILKLSELFRNEKISSPDLIKNLAAGLVIGGRILFESNQKENAIKAIKEALEFSHGNLKILEHALEILSQNDCQSVAIKELEKHSTSEINRIEFNRLQLRLYFNSEDFSKVLLIGQESLKEKAVDIQSFELILKSAKKSELSPQQIEAILEQGQKLFPEQSESFSALL